MIKRLFYAIPLTLILAVCPALAQSDSPLRGTWSGHWVDQSGKRDAVTVRFSIEDDHVVGELVNPETIAFSDVSFDSEHSSVAAEVQTSTVGKIHIDARIEEETRLNGTITIGDDSGEMKLTKWTFVPRPR